MQPHEKIKSYVHLVCEQIRWKKAHPRIHQEMENHIVDQRDAFMTLGLDEEAATDKAIANTGDAAMIGAQLDRTHRPKPQWGMFAATAVLLTFGLLVRLFVFNDEDRVGLISVRLFFTGVGMAGMFIAYLADFSLLGKYPKTIYFSITAFSLVLLFLSPELNRGLYYAQYAALLFPLACALAIFAARNKGYIGIALCGLAFVLPGLVLITARAITGFLHFAIVGMVVFGAAVWKNWFSIKRFHGFLLVLASVVLLAIVLTANMNDYHWKRFAAALHPSADPYGMGYWAMMTQELLRGAKWFGQGRISEAYMAGLMEPSAAFYTDSLLTALISLVGWIAFAIVVGVILFFVLKGFAHCFKQKSSLGFFVSLSIMLTFSVQVISYALFNLGIQFVSPISLPLISYSNTATVINLVLIGFMLSVFRTGDIVTDGESRTLSARNKYITWEGGKLTIHFKAQ
ncbi:MAG: FtsW/RodA/SpoVE family cell cycle protein [Oscillospiraceae bacterium]|nr:FtsW/RodA/SpoVE family cell cycle protein [Oscillospiraceae bacterium]